MPASRRSLRLINLAAAGGVLSALAQGGCSGAGRMSPGADGDVDARAGSDRGPLPGDAGTAEARPPDVKFSFFATSLEALRRLARSQNGFGGDLRYGQPDGLSGADRICSEIAEHSLPGSGAKGWRAFLSAAFGADGGGPVHAIDRIGAGPWYDRLGRLLAMDRAALLNPRPVGAHPAIINDFPNEYGVPNRQPDPTMPPVDNHHFLTGSTTTGRLQSPESTCGDWTTTAANAGRPRIGFSWSAGGRVHWISGADEGGCGAGVNLEQTGGADPSNPIVGSGGGYGGFYCFALSP